MLATTQIKLAWVPVGQTFLRTGFGRMTDSSQPLVSKPSPSLPRWRHRFCTVNGVSCHQLNQTQVLCHLCWALPHTWPGLFWFSTVGWRRAIINPHSQQHSQVSTLHPGRGIWPEHKAQNRELASWSSKRGKKETQAHVTGSEKFHSGSGTEESAHS